MKGQNILPYLCEIRLLQAERFYPQETQLSWLMPKMFTLGFLTSPQAVNTTLSNQISQAIIHAMQSQPEDRPASMMVWQLELQHVLSALSQTTPDTYLLNKSGKRKKGG